MPILTTPFLLRCTVLVLLRATISDMAVLSDGSYLMPDENGILRVLPPNPRALRSFPGPDEPHILGPPAPRPRFILGNEKVINRLYWKLDGSSSMGNSIFVFPEGQEYDNFDNLQPLFTGSGVHPLGHEPICEEPRTSITVGCSDLSIVLPDGWSDLHLTHVDGDQVLVPMTEDDQSSDGGSITGEICGDDDQPMKIMGCCGETRPSSDISPPTVHAEPPAEDITLEAYVSVIHPWLMSKREDLIAYLRLGEPDLSEDVTLVVMCARPADVAVTTENSWLTLRRLDVARRNDG